MSAWIRKLVVAPVFEDEEKTRAAGLLNAILLTMLTGAFVIALISVTAEHSIRSNLLISGVAIVILLVLLFLARRGRVRTASILWSLCLLGLVTVEIYMFRGIRDTTTSAYLVIIAIAALLLGGRAALVFGLLSILATLGVYYAEISGAIVVSMPALAGFIDWFLLCITLGIGTLVMRYAVHSIAQGFERARRHAQDLAEINRELTASRDMLQAQTRALERRARYLEATAAVAREATGMIDLQMLLSRVVTLISDRFGFYHVGVFLLDFSGEWAELRAASSEGGQRMLARGHRLRVGEQGIVGYVTGRGEPRIALDVGEDSVYFDNPDLLETRSEIALPLRTRGEIIGALDVQSTEPAAFTEEDMAVLQTLADQVAMAISNARLFQQVQEAIEMERRAYGDIGRKAWSELLRAQADRGYRYTGVSIAPAVGEWSPTMLRAAQTGRSVAGDSAGASALAVPIKVRDQVIGVLNFCKSTAGEAWTADEIELLEILAEQLGITLESARLFQEAQRRASREQLTVEITDKMRRATSVEGIIQAAVDELFGVLGTSRAFVRLGSVPSAGDDGKEGTEKEGVT